MSLNATNPAEAVLCLLGARSLAKTIDWQEVDWNRVIAFASAHLVLPALAAPLNRISHNTPLPGDLVGFMSGIAAANATRNRSLGEALRNIAETLNAIGTTPVALKGAAFLADGNGSGAQTRFMSDIDLLIPEARLHDCVRAFASLGYKPVSLDYDSSRVAHYPPLASPCGTFTVELHTRIFAFADYGLPASEVAANATASEIPGLAIPSSTHRMVHVLAHAQLHNRYAPIRRIVLKDILDIERLLAGRQGPDYPWSEVVACFTNPAERQHALSLAAAWQLAMHGEEADWFRASEIAWARHALYRLRRHPEVSRRSAMLDAARVEIYRFRTEEGHLRHRLRQLVDPRGLASAAGSFHYRMQQRLWSAGAR
ncbi:MAG: hypothetical protein RLZ98_80 [Pseudomonadota bacterium]|jgi:hypothetical protein